ncbi:S-methyl-5'-thioadenosine phosphorylase [Coccinella septempunctata]|uniref:S-methyl-5'-thioadenosine phosphorylase n=1 Tax=Coccinella septempunctata TaxID=41139 RepID=UPI001D097C32|nr:S-methyl-5'-thioadenosine phosphorylase [Coccinella septempunctata]
MAPSIKVGIIGGTGMDNPDILKNRTEKEVTTPFGYPSDKLILGEIGGVPCVLLARHGRKHNILPHQVNYRANIWALKQEGCTQIIVSTATGSLREDYKPGDLVILNNFIDNTHGRHQTFYDGSCNALEGICHIPMEPPYCEKLRQVIIKTAEKLGIFCHSSGTIIAVNGPRFSSKAESLMFRQWGADVISMTTCPEVVLAKEAGISYAGVALVTDYDCWKPNTEHVSHELVLKIFNDNIGKVVKLICASVENMMKEDWSQKIQENEEFVKKSIWT